MVEALPEKMKFSVFVTNDDFIVRDHQLHNVRAVPGVTFLDFIYRFLIMRKIDIQGMEIKNVLFKQPVVTTPEYDQKITVMLERANGIYIFKGMSRRIKNGTEYGEWVENLTGEIHFSGIRPVKRIDIEKLIEGSERKVDMEECYVYSRRSGLVHYEFMKLLGTVYSGKGYLIADTSLSALAQSYMDSFYLHPAFLDGSLAVPGASILPKVEIDYSNSKPYIPIYISTFKAFDRLKARSFVYIDESKIELSPSQDIMYFDVEIYGEDGLLDAYYRRFGAKRVRSEEQIKSIEADVSRYAVQAVPLKEEAEHTEVKEHITGIPLRKRIEKDIREMIAGMTGVNAEDIDVDKEFYEQGLDSKNILKMVECIENKMGVKLYPTLLFEYTSISKLAEYIEIEHKDSYLTTCEYNQEKEQEKHGVCEGQDNSGAEEQQGIDFLYLPRWLPAALDTENYTGETSGIRNVLLMYPKPADKLADAIASQYGDEQVYRIEISKEDAVIGEKSWRVNVDRRSSIIETIEKIGEIDSIFFLGIQPTGYSLSDVSAFEEIQKTGIISLFRTVKALSSLKKLSKVKKITAVTNYVWQVLPSDVSWPFAGAVWGFVKSLSKEYPDVDINMMDIEFDGSEDEDEIQRNAACIISEPPHKKGEEIAFRGGIRFSRSIEPLVVKTQENNIFKKNGVYLIIGGTGGIGLETAKYLAGNYCAKLALVSRNKPDGVQSKKIEEIKAAGGEVLHIKADVSDPWSIKTAVKEIKSTYGRINGCIHSALVLRDKSIEMMNEELLLEVLVPKAMGTVALYNALKDEKLDFMLFYSSAQSFMGSFGQANYAAACTCKDAIASSIRQRESYPVSVINWGYWGSVGVVATDEYRKRIVTAGIGSIEPEEGMEVVSQTLSRRINQVLAIKMDEKLCQDAGMQKENKNRAVPLEIPSLFWEITGETSIDVMESDLLDETYHRESWNMFERMQQCLLLSSFRKMGVFNSCEEKYIKDELMKKLGIVKEYERLFHALLDIMQRAGFIKIHGNIVNTLHTVEDKELLKELKCLEKTRDVLNKKYSEIRPYNELLWKCVQSYPEVLTGRINHMTVLFPGGSTHMVENIYRGSAITDFYNSLVANIIQKYVDLRLEQDPDATVSILEVGAGTGGTSVFVAKALRNRASNVKYFYTDLALEFTLHNDAKFREEYPFIEFRALDIEKDAASQGFKKHSMDIVFASNVLHATRRIPNSLSHVKELLKTKGLFIVNEATEINDFVTLTFGLTSGWWLFEDSDLRIPYSPLLAPEQWERILMLHGFENVCSFELKGKKKIRAGQTVIVGESDGYIKEGEYFSPDRLRVADIRLKFDEASAGQQDLAPMDEVTEKLIGNPNIQPLHIFDLEYPEAFLTYWKKLRENNRYPLSKNFNYFFEEYDGDVLKNGDIREIDLIRVSQGDGRLLHMVVNTPSAKNMEVVMTGKGIPVILISGFGFTATQWYYQFKECYKDFRLIHINIPGIGLSEGSDDVSLTGISRSFVETLDELGIRIPVHVIGSSWGGLVAQMLAKINPERVASVILSCSFCTMAQKIVKTLQNKFRKDFDNEHDRPYMNIVLDGEYVNYDLMPRFVKQFNNKFSTEDIIRHIKCPTLIITGERDTIIDKTQSRYMNENIAGSVYHEITGAGHVPNLTKYKEFNRLITDFIMECENEYKTCPEPSRQRDLTAYCGANCRICPSYIASIKNSKVTDEMAMAFWKKYFGHDMEIDNVVCDACNSENGRLVGHCKNCVVRECARKRGYDTCSLCDEYPCKELLNVYERMPLGKAELDKRKAEQVHL